MKNTLCTLISLSLGAIASAQTGSFTPYSAETYGGVSGDVPMVGLGLVLELVDGDTAAPTLRLFGGPAGQEAAIMLSTGRAAAPGPHASQRLIEESRITYRGAFDWRGYYEVTLDSTGATPSFFAQGLHVGIFELAPGGEKLMQLSNGLHVFPTVCDEPALGFDDLLPHFPDPIGVLPLTTPLDERLQIYLNSPGDSTKVKLQVEASLGAGANGGAEGEVEFLIKRTADNLYEVSVASDVAAKAGVEAVEGVEANVAAGVGVTRIFRFNSAPGAARGILGIMLSLQCPQFAPGKWIADSGLAGEAENLVKALQLSVELAQEVAQAAEQLLWTVLDVALVNSQQQRNAAHAQFKYAQAKLAGAKWYEVPYWAGQVAIWHVSYLATAAKFELAKVARVEGEKALHNAQAEVENHREALRAILAAGAQATRIASAVSQLRGYSADHFAGTEFRQKVKGDAKVGVPIPVDIEGLGASVSAEAEVLMSVLFEGNWGDESSRITVSRQFESKGTLEGSFSGLVGGNVVHKETGGIQEVFEFSAGSFSKSTGLSLASDTSLAASAGIVASASVGAGRSKSFSLVRDEFTMDDSFDLGAFLTGQDRDLFADITVGFGLQDRLVRSAKCEIKASVAGNGGGFTFEMEWADQGRRLERSTTIRDALNTLIDGVKQLPDAESGRVLMP